MTRTDKNTVFNDVCEQLTSEGFNGIAKVIEMLMNAAMEIERAKAIGAGPYERTRHRKAHANGFKKRKFQSRMGELDLKIPQVRGLAFYPGCLEKGQRSEKALKAAVAEMYLNGVSTRKVTKITEYLCGFEISSSQVSKVTQELDLEIKSFYLRPLTEFPIVYLDARYEKVRHGGHIKNMAVLWAVGVDNEGRRQVLGLSCKLSEAEIHWRGFLSSLLERGLSGVQLIISDAHEGLAKARKSVFPTVPWQRCMVHFLRNANAFIPQNALQTPIFQHLKDLFNAPSYEMAMFQKKEVLKKYDKAAPKLVEWLDENLDQAMTFFQFPRQLWKRIRSTNIVERFNREIRRRTRVVSIFPGEKSVFRLVGSLLIEIHEEWIAGPKYLNYESIAELNAEDGIYRKKVA